MANDGLNSQKNTQSEFVQGATGSASIPYDSLPHIVFAGRSNVGKSSTINLLLGAPLARSSSTPGKTREMNFYRRTLANPSRTESESACYFVDLPGYGYAKMSKADRDKMLKRMLWYLDECQQAIKLVLIVVDAKAGLTAHDREFLDMIPETLPVLLVVNKVDKLNQKETSALIKHLVAFEQEFLGTISYELFSATQGKGRGAVRARIEQALTEARS